MTFPTPHSVGWHVRSADGPDRFREAPTYTPPKGEPGTPVSVIGWTAKSGSGARDGRQNAGHDRTETTVELYAPPDWTPAVGDLIDLPDGQCEVIGVEDYRWGFHGWKPGTVVLLQRIEG